MTAEIAVSISLVSAAIALGSLYHTVRVHGLSERRLFEEKRTAVILQAREAVAKMDRARMLDMEVHVLTRDVDPLGDKAFAEKLALGASLREEGEDLSIRGAEAIEAIVEMIRNLEAGDLVGLEKAHAMMGEVAVMADHVERMAMGARDAARSMRASYEEDVRVAR